MSRCAMCRRPFGASEVVYDCEGRDGEEGAICEECDASFAPALRPSLGFVPALLASLPSLPRAAEYIDAEVAGVMRDLGFDRRTAERHVAQRRHLQAQLRNERRAFDDMEHA